MPGLPSVNPTIGHTTTQLDSAGYTVFKPSLSSSVYDTGDIYSSDYDDPHASFRRAWSVTG